MSWNCHICGTQNDDVTPVCTVCDTLAPVIESYLSSDAIERKSFYDHKLDEVYAYEAMGNFEAMCEASIEAVALYKENGLAVDKLKKAMKSVIEARLKTDSCSLITRSLEKGEYEYAYSLLKILMDLSLTDCETDSLRREIEARLGQRRDVDIAMNSSLKSMATLDVDKARGIVEDALILYPDNDALNERLADINQLAQSLADKLHRNATRRKPLPTVTSTPVTGQSGHTNSGDAQGVMTVGIKRKFPKVGPRK